MSKDDASEAGTGLAKNKCTLEELVKSVRNLSCMDIGTFYLLYYVASCLRLFYESEAYQIIRVLCFIQRLLHNLTSREKERQDACHTASFTTAKFEALFESSFTPFTIFFFFFQKMKLCQLGCITFPSYVTALLY